MSASKELVEINGAAFDNAPQACKDSFREWKKTSVLSGKLGYQGDHVSANYYNPFVEVAKDIWLSLWTRLDALEAENAAMRAERERRNKVDPITRLHNLCDGLQYEKGESPYCAKAWDELTAENDRLRAELAKLQQAVSDDVEQEAECRKLLARWDTSDSFRTLTLQELIEAALAELASAAADAVIDSIEIESQVLDDVIANLEARIDGKHKGAIAVVRAMKGAK